MEFGKEYFDSIWGTVHRHDYCSYWADRLINEFGKCRILDAGTGCGYLVKLLREKGCDAWGIDSSEYAITNTCAPGYVLNASITNTPFNNKRFDVIFSNGLWEYLTEEEIKKGAKEIWRIGHKQIHNIDHDKCDFREDFVTWKSQEWWDEQLAAPKVLVSCPTHESKEYAHEEWIKMSKNIDYPNYEVFVVDNSPTPECAKRWGFEWVETTPEMDQCQRMAASMEIAQQKFLKENFQWWFNVEIDVIPDPQMIKTLLKHGEGADWIAHVYPPRGGTEECCSGIGCSLWSRRLIEDFPFKGSGDHLNQCVDSYFWNWVRPQNKYLTRELWGHVPTEHLINQNG